MHLGGKLWKSCSHKYSSASIVIVDMRTRTRQVQRSVHIVKLMMDSAQAVFSHLLVLQWSTPVDCSRVCLGNLAYISAYPSVWSRRCLPLFLYAPTSVRPLDPRVAEITFDSTGLVKAFQNLDNDELPQDTIAMHMTPDGQHWWLAGQYGEIKEVQTCAIDYTI